MTFKERSEAMFDQQMNYRRERIETFHYQNTMSNSTTQDKAVMLLTTQEGVRQQEQQRQHQAELERQKQKQVQKQLVSLQQETEIKPQQWQKRVYE